MTEDAGSDDAALDAPEASYRLVCGACKRILGDRYPSRARADAAADRHVRRGHPGLGSAVVLAVPADELEQRAQQLLLVAVVAHHRSAGNEAPGPNGA